MTFNRDNVIGSGSFSGASKVHSKEDGGLGPVLQAILQKQGAIQVAGASISGLTDNSGGTAGASIAAVTLPSESDVSGGTTGCTAASLNTGLDTVMNAYATLLEQANLVLAELGLGSVGEGPGTPGSGTIAAADDTISANSNDTDSVDYGSAINAFQDVLDKQATVVAVVNVCKAAVGLTAVPVATGAGSAQGAIASGLDISTTAISNATSSADAVSSVLLTEANAAIDVLSDNVALLADQLDLVTGVAADTALVYAAG